MKFWIKEIKSHTLVYLLLAVILVGAFFVRVYRTEALLRFYFDQGRDALVIWKLWHEGKPFLIGPVTGLAGIFLGPFYYYLIAPFYLLGGGNPIYPAAFLAFLVTCAIAVTYYLGWQMQSRMTGLIAAAIAGFSYYMVLAGRWLANPTPIFLTSVLLLFAMWKLVEEKTKYTKVWWLVIAALIGVSLHFEAASAVFYIPMVLVFYVYMFFTDKSSLLDRKTLVLALAFFGLTLLPQIVFNFRHENLLFNNFAKVLIEERSFRSPFSSYNLIKKRDFFWDVFSSKIFPGPVKYANLYYYASIIGLLLALKKISKAASLLVVFIGVPMVGYIFFQGNYGNIYDYYLTGYYLPMILLFSIGFGYIWKSLIGKVIIILFFISFLRLSLTLDKNLIMAGVDGPTHITMGNQLQAVDWIILDANGSEFNVDVYVPPVIPYAYDYLFLWQTTSRCPKDKCGLVTDRPLPTLYILYEVDPPHPERLSAWLSKYENSTRIEVEQKFGGIIVQRRIRMK